ncbi:MAG TPA: ABC transporter permease [Terriglobales bacterium]
MWSAGEATARGLGWALRRMKRRWAVMLMAVVTLGLAMGASTAMFSVFNQLVVNPLPFDQSRQLVWLQPSSLRTGAVQGSGFSIPDFLDLRAQSHSLQPMAAYFSNVATLVGQGAPQHVDYAIVSGDFFAALRVPAALGRTFNRADEEPSIPQTAILSQGLWRTRFGGDASVLGRNLDLDNRLLTIVGVMPAGFDFPRGTELWLPKPLASDPVQVRSWRFLSAFARLGPGQSLGGAQKEMDAISLRLAQAYPKSNSDHGIHLEPLDQWVAGPIAVTLEIMMAAVLLLLCLACVNVGNLLLGESVGRRREMALQASLGAGRRHLLGQLLLEGLVLAGMAAAVGWGLAGLVVPLVRSVHPASLPQLAQVRLNGWVLGFSALVTLLTAVWFGLAPAWELLRPSSMQSLHRSSGPQAARSRMPNGLVMAEVASTVVLMIASGLFWQSLRQLQHTNPGYRTDHVLTFRVSLLFNSTAELEAGFPYFARLNQRLQQLPGVRAAGLVSELPYMPAQGHGAVSAADNAAQLALPQDERPQADLLAVLPGYFAAAGIQLQGRGFVAADNQADGPRVAIVSAHLAQRLFPGRPALEQGIVVEGRKAPYQIVGIAADIGQRGPGTTAADDLYLPLEQSHRGEMSAAVWTQGDPKSLLPAIRRISGEINPQVPVYEVSTLGQRWSDVTLPERYRTRLLLAMAVLALLLATAGLYGVLAHSVAQRRQEIGIRMALGASAAQVWGRVVGQSLRMILTGTAVGLLAAWWLRNSLHHLLHAAALGEFWMWIGVPLLVIGVGMAAAVIPARRAARVDPVTTLRCD